VKGLISIPLGVAGAVDGRLQGQMSAAAARSSYGEEDLVPLVQVQMLARQQPICHMMAAAFDAIQSACW
jgi:hypothetical protein